MAGVLWTAFIKGDLSVCIKQYLHSFYNNFTKKNVTDVCKNQTRNGPHRATCNR